MLKMFLSLAFATLAIRFFWKRHRKRRNAAAQAAIRASLDEFQRLSRDAMRYAASPRVTVMYHVAYWPEDPVLIRTTADPYHRRAYVETHRCIAGKVVHAVCLYQDRDETPVEAAAAEFPAEQTNVYVLRTRIEDIVRSGAFISLRDPAGRPREYRMPKEAKHHA